MDILLCYERLCVLMYSVCQQHCRVYISNMVQSVADSAHCQGLWLSTFPTFVVPRTRTKLSELIKALHHHRQTLEQKRTLAVIAR